MIETLAFLLYYFVVLILGAILITGWFAITRGEWYKNPDDTSYWSGKLFSPWLRFWTKEKKGAEVIYYRKGEFEKITLQIANLIGIKDYKIDKQQSHLEVSDSVAAIIERKKQYIFFHLKVVVSIKNMLDDQSLVFFYQEFPRYKFPHWVRAPLATCIYCHGSIYGSIIWWGCAWIFQTYFDLQIWKLVALFWVPFCISQSFVAPYLNKQL